MTSPRPWPAWIPQLRAPRAPQPLAPWPGPGRWPTAPRPSGQTPPHPQLEPVARDPAPRITAGHMITGYPDHALDVVMHSRGGAEQARDRVPQPHQRRLCLGRHRVPGAFPVEDHDVATVNGAEIVDHLVDEHLVADVEGVLHRR